MADLVAGLDIGATWLRAALADLEGRVLFKFSERTARSQEALEAQLSRLARVLAAKARSLGARLRAVGVGAVGPLDLREGVIVNPPNLPVKRVEVTRALSEALEDVPVLVLNDCTAACYGEWLLGAGRGLTNMAYVAIGTGIGGGAVVDGHLLLGWCGNAVEIGHLVVDAGGRLTCGCGGRGHWEAYCSGANLPRFLAYWASERGISDGELEAALEKPLQELTAKDIMAAAKRGTRLALEFLEEVAILNAAGLASVVNAFSPELLAVGGSVALENYDLIVEKALVKLADFAFNPVPLVKPATFGGEATLMGAVALAIKPPEGLSRVVERAG